MLATKKVPFKTIKGLSFPVNPTYNQETDPKLKQIYPSRTIPKAIKNAPSMLEIVPNQEIYLIIYFKTM